MSEKFEFLVRNAVAVERDLREHCNDSRLTSQASLKFCYEYGGTSSEEVSELRAVLNTGTLQLRETRAFVGQVYKLIIEGRYSGVPKDLVRMSAAPLAVEARQELAELGHSLWTAWAIAIENVRDRHPEKFGLVSDPEQWQDKLDNLKIRREELFQKIGESFESDDLEVSDIRSDGRALVTARLSEGKVSIGPLHDFAERLVNFLLQQDPEWGKDKSVKVAA